MPNNPNQKLFCEYCVQDFASEAITPSYYHDPSDQSEAAQEEFSKGQMYNRCPECRRKLVHLKG